jgi:ketosteroid isomerase-like protein
MRTPRDVVQAHYDASAAGDLEAMLADLAPQARWTEAAGSPLAGTYTGREAIVANVFAPILRDWEVFRFELERLIAEDRRVAAVGTYAGTFRATGKSMRARVVHVWEVEDERIVRFEQFADTKEIDAAGS